MTRPTADEPGRRDYLVSNLQDPFGRVQGVGDVNVFGAQYAMRIWLNPDKLASYQLIPSDVHHRDPERRIPKSRRARSGGVPPARSRC